LFIYLLLAYYLSYHVTSSFELTKALQYVHSGCLFRHSGNC